MYGRLPFGAFPYGRGERPLALGEVVFADKWAPPLSEPARFRVSARALAARAAADAFRFDPYLLTLPETISPDRWQVPFGEPVRFRRSIGTAHHDYAVLRVGFGPFEESVTADRWVPPLSEPRRYRRPLLTASQQFGAFVGFAPFPESVTADRWVPPLSEPRRYPRRLLPAEHQFRAFVQFGPFGEPVTADRWAPGYNQPVIYRPMLAVADQQHRIWSEWTIVLDQPVIAIVASVGFEMAPTSRYAEMLADGRAEKAFGAILKPWFLSDRS